MKKIALIAALLCVMQTAICQRTLFREYGSYGTASYTMLTNLNRKEYNFMLNGVTLSGGFQIRPKTCVELGVGFLADASGVYTQIPFTVALRTHYMNTRLTPMTELFAGYALPLKKTGTNSNGDKMCIDQGGVTAGVNVGGRFSISRKVAINAYIGWHFFMINEFRVFTADKDPIAQDAWAAHCFRFGIGLMF
ncbi:MAG: hypothetical protein K5867_10230 [Bacteroidales bacterium]|nr:hypothetical protein [Bacteroidales bacterium]